MTHDEVDSTWVGQHLLVTRFLKGAFNCRPPAPITWNVDTILGFLKSLLENHGLSLHHNLVTLMALANADRCSDLGALDLRHRCAQENSEKFIIPGLTKSQFSGLPILPNLPRGHQVVSHPDTALLHRKVKGPSPGSWQPLFIAVRKPHKPVKAATIGHWLKPLMKKPRIDTGTFSAHSTSQSPWECQLGIFWRQQVGLHP